MLLSAVLCLFLLYTRLFRLGFLSPLGCIEHAYLTTRKHSAVHYTPAYIVCIHHPESHKPVAVMV